MKTRVSAIPKVVEGYDSLEAEIRLRLRDSEASLRSIETETGISKTHLANFKNLKRNLSFQNLNELAKYFKVRFIIKNF